MGRLARIIRRRLPPGFLGMLALVVLAEGYFARNDLKFSRLEAEDWAQTARLASEGLPRGGAFFFGDSQVKFGVSPLLLESRLGQPSHCLAIQGGQAPSSYLLLKRALDSGVIPSMVLVDFEPHLLRDGPRHNHRMWSELVTPPEAIELAWEARDAGLLVEMGLGLALPSYRQREEIRENLRVAIRGETPFMASWLGMAIRNKGMNRGALAMAAGDPAHVHDHSRWGNPTPTPWRPDPTNDLYARKFLRLCLEDEIPVYYLRMPVVPGLQEKYEASGMDARHLAWLRRLQKTFPNLSVLDWRRSGYRDRAFNDAMHLNVEGALSITAALGDHLAEVARGVDVGLRWVEMPGFRARGVEIAVEDSNRSHVVMTSKSSRRR